MFSSYWRSAALFAFVIALVFLPGLANLQNLLPTKSYALAFVYTLLSLALLLIPSTVIPPKLYALLLLPFALIVPLELVHVTHYDGYTTVSGLASAFETNPEEALGFLHGYRHYFYVTWPLVAVAYFLLVTRMSKAFRWNAPAKFAIVGAAFGLLLLFGIKTSKDAMESGAPVRQALMETYGRVLSMNYPINDLVNLTRYYQGHAELARFAEAKAKFSFAATHEKQAPLTFILVLGESSRRANWQLAGYDRPTTPELAARHDVLYFARAISAATQTRESLQLALTRATPTNLLPIQNEKSVISAFKSAGFETAWLSNQPKISGADTPIYAIAREADYLSFTNTDYDSYSRLDSEVVSELDRYLSAHQNPYQFVVVHTLGSHEVYRDRYPSDYAKFQPASSGDDYNFASPGIRERLKNSYDNSILYTDHVLNEIIDLAQHKRSNSVVFYFSDHGENILDEGSNRIGHGGTVPTHYVADIPMFFWMSDGYRQLRPDVWSSLATNLDRTVSTLCVFDTLLAVSDVKVSQSKSTCNLLDAQSNTDWPILGAHFHPLAYSEIPGA